MGKVMRKNLTDRYELVLLKFSGMSLPVGMALKNIYNIHTELLYKILIFIFCAAGYCIFHIVICD